MPGMGFLDRGSFDKTYAIMTRLLKELKEETGTERMLDSLQERLDVRFTPGGLLMVVVPLTEAAYVQQLRGEVASRVDVPFDKKLDVNLDTATQSIEVTMAEARDNPSPADGFLTDRGKYPARTSLSVLRALHRKWCNIPPFCSPT